MFLALEVGAQYSSLQNHFGDLLVLPGLMVETGVFDSSQHSSRLGVIPAEMVVALSEVYVIALGLGESLGVEQELVVHSLFVSLDKQGSGTGEV